MKIKYAALMLLAIGLALAGIVILAIDIIAILHLLNRTICCNYTTSVFFHIIIHLCGIICGGLTALFGMFGISDTQKDWKQLKNKRDGSSTSTRL